MDEEGPNIPWEQDRIELRPAAVGALHKLDEPVRRRLHGAIALLAEDPHPPAAHTLKGRPGLRVRVGDFRIIYAVDDGPLVVVVVTLVRPLTSADGRIAVTEARGRPRPAAAGRRDQE